MLVINMNCPEWIVYSVFILILSPIYLIDSWKYYSWLLKETINSSLLSLDLIVILSVFCTFKIIINVKKHVKFV